MSYVQGRVLRLFAAAAVVVLIAQVAEAQREGGRRGRRGMLNRFIPSVQLVAESDDVQVALNLTAEQKEKVDEINGKLREDRREVVDQREGDWRAAREEMEKLNQEASSKLAEVLDEGQQKRLLGVSIQVNGAAALNEPAVAKELNITDEQKTKLEEARETNMRSLGDAFRDMRDLSGDERRAKADELRTEADKNLLAVLTDEQKSQFEALKGEPVEVDMSEFRGGGFGGRDGRGRRGDGRGRDRADRNANENADDSSN